MPAATAVALIGAVVVAGVAGALSGGSDGDAEPPPPTETAIDAPPSSSGVTGPTEPPPTVGVSTIPEAQKTKLSQPMSLGMTGDEVRAIQDRLKDLHFDPGPVDGQFGALTEAAVWAFEKLILGTPKFEATGVVTPAMWNRMQDEIIVKPKRPEAASVNHTEIYLAQQVVIFFQDDHPALITHMSMGDNKEWCEEVTISVGEYGNEDGKKPLVRGECGRSYTPPGVFEYDREVVGTRESGLGSMWNPIYFNYGIAIHGALEVPLHPASHGCIRIPLPLSEYIQDLMELGDQVYVFDGKRPPESVPEEEQLPRFNWLDPDWSPPTTTTLPPTTTAPPTTLPPTTLPPTTTTTTLPPTTTTTTLPPTTTAPKPPVNEQPPPTTAPPGPNKPGGR